MRTNLIKVAQEDKKRAWATEGMALFGEILRNNSQGIEALGDHIISSLVKYLDANQGALFILNDIDNKDIHLELLSCYAWDKKKFVELKVNNGEGLVGQAWLEADVIYLTEIPDNYIKITSGLGDANPSSILIVPLTVNDKTYGVIEIASFKFMDEYQIEFVKKLGESIASTLSNSKINQRTKILLEQSQIQAEELRAQEEEMRQNMEEMQATQEAMERKELELLNQSTEFSAYITGVNASILTIEFTPQGEIITANTNFLAATGYTLHEIVGKHHKLFVETINQNSEEYKEFWPNLAKGIPNQGEFVRVGKSGDKIVLKATYTPIINPITNQVFKVVKFAMDITESKVVLAEMNDMVEEIKQQEEEMRQNLEEMQAIQEEMEKVNIHTKEMADSLNIREYVFGLTTILSESDLQGNITFVNQKLIEVSKYSEEELLGKPHNIFRHPDMPKALFKLLWENLKAGKVFNGIVKNKAKDGTPYWVDGCFVPIKNSEGVVVKYIGARYHIKDEAIAEELYNNQMKSLNLD